MIKPDFEFYWQDEYERYEMLSLVKNLSSVVGYIYNRKQHHADVMLFTAMDKSLIALTLAEVD